MSAERMLSPLRRPVETTLHVLDKAHHNLERKDPNSNPLIREAVGLAKFSVAFWAVVVSMALNTVGGPTPAKPPAEGLPRRGGETLFDRETA